MVDKGDLEEIERTKRTTMRSLARQRMTIPEFLYLYEGAEGRWELVNGVPTLMAGGTRRHALIAANILVVLGQRLRGRRCEAFGSDFGVRTGEDTVRYPDVSVYCDRRDLDADPDQQKFGRYPLYLFEVLSPSSAHIDMGAKLAEYQGLSSVQGVFMIEPTGRTVTAFLRGSSGEWPATGSMVEEGGTVMLAALGIQLRWDEIFAD